MAALVAYDEFLEWFGSDELLVVALAHQGEPFSEMNLGRIRRLSDQFAGLPDVIDVWSLTHMEVMVDLGGRLATKPMIESFPPDPEAVDLAQSLVRHHPLYQLLMSQDGEASAIIILSLGWLFRSALAVTAPLLVVAISTLWAAGVMGWVGWDANIISNILPPMICAVGIADSVHFLQHI